MVTEGPTEPVLPKDAAVLEAVNSPNGPTLVDEGASAPATVGWGKAALNWIGVGGSVAVHFLLILWVVGSFALAEKFAADEVVPVTLVPAETAPPPPLEFSPPDIEAPAPETPREETAPASPRKAAENVEPADPPSPEEEENAEFLEALASYGVVVADDPTKSFKDELSALTAQAMRCWNIPVGWTDPRQVSVTVQLRLNRDGTVNGTPTVLEFPASELGKAAAVGAIRAVVECGPFDLPEEKYDQWNEVQLRFEP